MWKKIIVILLRFNATMDVQNGFSNPFQIIPFRGHFLVVHSHSSPFHSATQVTGLIQASRQQFSRSFVQRKREVNSECVRLYMYIYICVCVRLRVREKGYNTTTSRSFLFCFTKDLQTSIVNFFQVDNVKICVSQYVCISSKKLYK